MTPNLVWGNRVKHCPRFIISCYGYCIAFQFSVIPVFQVLYKFNYCFPCCFSCILLGKLGTGLCKVIFNCFGIGNQSALTHKRKECSHTLRNLLYRLQAFKKTATNHGSTFDNILITINFIIHRLFWWRTHDYFGIGKIFPSKTSPQIFWLTEITMVSDIIVSGVVF